MNIATAWLITTFITLFVWGSTFGLMWSTAKKSRPKTIGMIGTVILGILGFISVIGLIWYSVATGVYVGGKP